MGGLLPFSCPVHGEVILLLSFLLLPCLVWRLDRHRLSNRTLGCPQKRVQRLVAQLLGVCACSVRGRRHLRTGDLRGRLEASRWGTRRWWCFFGLLLEQRRQVGLGGAHGLSDLDHDALVESQLIALVQLVAVLVVGVAEEVAGLVVHHDPVVEGVELEVAILPLLLLLADVWRVETAELGDWCRLRCGELRVLRVAEGCRHRLCVRMRRARRLLQDMGGGRRGCVGAWRLSGYDGDALVGRRWLRRTRLQDRARVKMHVTQPPQWPHFQGTHRCLHRSVYSGKEGACIAQFSARWPWLTLASGCPTWSVPSYRLLTSCPELTKLRPASSSNPSSTPALADTATTGAVNPLPHPLPSPWHPLGALSFIHCFCTSFFDPALHAIAVRLHDAAHATAHRAVPAQDAQ